MPAVRIVAYRHFRQDLPSSVCAEPAVKGTAVPQKADQAHQAESPSDSESDTDTDTDTDSEFESAITPPPSPSLSASTNDEPTSSNPTTTATAATNKTTLLTLPPELHAQILTSLPYPDLLSLSLTNVYFSHLVRPHLTVRSRVNWVTVRRALNLPVPGAQKLSFATDATFVANGEVKSILRRRRRHVECVERYRSFHPSRSDGEVPGRTISVWNGERHVEVFVPELDDPDRVLASDVAIVIDGRRQAFEVFFAMLMSVVGLRCCARSRKGRGLGCKVVKKMRCLVDDSVDCPHIIALERYERSVMGRVHGAALGVGAWAGRVCRALRRAVPQVFRLRRR